MSVLSNKEIESYKADGAIVLRKKFDIKWIEKLKTGIKKDIKNPRCNHRRIHNINKKLSFHDLKSKHQVF